MSDGNKVDEFYDRMASPDPENGEATMPDDDVRDEGNVLSTPVAGGTDVTDGLERPPYWTDAMERQFRRRVSADFERFQERHAAGHRPVRTRVRGTARHRQRQVQGTARP